MKNKNLLIVIVIVVAVLFWAPIKAAIKKLQKKATDSTDPPATNTAP